MKKLELCPILRMQKLAGIIIDYEPIELLSEITESKQVGVLYHFTNVPNIKKILASGLMFIKNNEFVNKSKPVDPKKKYAISVTRSPNFGGSDPHGYKSKGCRLTLDGDKISQRYKILPINIDNTWIGQYHQKKSGVSYFTTKKSKFYEERIYSPTPGYIPLDYIKQIDVIHYKWNKLSPKYIEMLNSLNTRKIPINSIKKF